MVEESDGSSVGTKDGNVEVEVEAGIATGGVALFFTPRCSLSIEISSGSRLIKGKLSLTVEETLVETFVGILAELMFSIASIG